MASPRLRLRPARPRRRPPPPRPLAVPVPKAAAILFPHLGEMSAARFKMLVADAHGRDIRPDFANTVTRTVLVGLIGQAGWVAFCASAPTGPIGPPPTD